MTDRQFKTITKKLHFYNQGGIKNLCTMTETMLRQVMEEAAGVTQAYIRKLVQHDVDQQNKIALLSAKVYKLEKEKQDQERQQQELANKADTNHALVEQMAELEERYEKQKEINKELVDENEELQKLKRECETSLCRAEYQYNYEQLTKAKEIIRDFLSVAVDYIDKEDKNYSFITEAEEFLKDQEEEPCGQ